MKIDGTDPIDKAASAKPKGSEPVKGPSFGDVLKSVANQGVTPAQSAGAVSPLPEVSLTQLKNSPEISARQIVSRLDDMLTDLQMLGNALGVTDLPIERLESFIDDLSNNKDELASMIGAIPDDELRALASETLSLVIEQISGYHAGYAQ